MRVEERRRTSSFVAEGRKERFSRESTGWDSPTCALSLEIPVEENGDFLTNYVCRIPPEEAARWDWRRRRRIHSISVDPRGDQVDVISIFETSFPKPPPPKPEIMKKRITRIGGTHMRNTMLAE